VTRCAAATCFPPPARRARLRSDASARDRSRCRAVSLPSCPDRRRDQTAFLETPSHRWSKVGHPRRSRQAQVVGGSSRVGRCGRALRSAKRPALYPVALNGVSISSQGVSIMFVDSILLKCGRDIQSRIARTVLAVRGALTLGLPLSALAQTQTFCGPEVKEEVAQAPGLCTGRQAGPRKLLSGRTRVRCGGVQPRQHLL
jgi:hypothetical protein